MTPAERTLMDKWRRGERITALDHIPTIETMDELTGFREQLKRAGRMTPEIVTALLRQETRIGATRGAASRP